MYVDARDGSSLPSSTVPDESLPCLAVVVTLVSIALLTSSLRVYTCGRLLRSFAIDDWLALAAALSTIGVLTTFACLVNLDFGKRSWNETSSSVNISNPDAWFLASNLLYTIGIGFAKLSVAFFLLRVFAHRYCRHLLYGIICLLATSTLVWCGSALLQCVPIAAAWSFHGHLRARCMSRSIYTALASVNDATNTGTDLVLVILLLPIICSPAVKLATRASLVAAICLGLVACAAAIVRTRVAYNTWKNEKFLDHQDIQFTVWNIVELTAVLTAASVPTLEPLAKVFLTLLRKRQQPVVTANLVTPHSDHSSYHSTCSSHTVIYRPNTAYFPSLTRFHDDVSNLDFDIETPATRTRTHTLRSRAMHSRNVSDWSQFSGFTYYTNPTEPSDLDHAGLRPAGVSMKELEEIVRGLGVGRSSGIGLDVGLAVTAMNSTLPHEQDQGMEMTDIRSDLRDETSEVSHGRSVVQRLGTSSIHAA